jgi:hypothetical protein
MHPERIYFEKLKEEISGLYRAKNLGIPENIVEWNGKTIEGFQNDLQQAVKSTISVRWFYNHIKSDNEGKIPRTDVLDLLCRYAGYTDWAEYISKNKVEGAIPVSTEQGTGNNEKQADKSKLLMISLGLILIVGVAWLVIGRPSGNAYQFCFLDSDTGVPIKKSKIEIKLFKNNESAQVLMCDSNGCLTLNALPGKVKFVVNAQYYRPDTIVRTLTSPASSESIMLKPDDYALMINIFSRSDVKDWEKRRLEMEAMFTDDATIFQVDPVDRRAMEMYNKEEFIGKMTMPLSSLKNIEVLETWYSGKKISGLRFIQKDENKN